MLDLAEKTLNWQEVDEAASVTGEIKIAYDAYKAAQKVEVDKRREFEKAFIAVARKKKVIDDPQTLRFGYRFGKLAVAVDAVDKPKTGSILRCDAIRRPFAIFAAVRNFDRNDWDV